MKMSHALKIVKLADVPMQPWRNGGGTTQQLLTWPPNGPPGIDASASNTAQEWALRISVATIAAAGPFSNFAGVQRCFAVLQGPGVHLQGPGIDRQMRAGDVPLAFDGETPLHAQLLDGPTLDLNLMVMRSAGRAHMQRAVPGGDLRAAAKGALRWCGLFSLQPMRLVIGGDDMLCEAGSLVWSDDAHTLPWRLLSAELSADPSAEPSAEPPVDPPSAWFMTLETL